MWKQRNVLFYTEEDRKTIGMPAKMIKNQILLCKIKNIKVLKRNESYEYLGKLITINGDDPKQVSEIISTYKDQVEKICQCKLPFIFSSIRVE